MTVELGDAEARRIAAMLEVLRDAPDGVVPEGMRPDAAMYADELKYRAKPPLTPILEWVEERQHRFTVPDSMTAEDVAREIQETIAEHGDATEAVKPYHPDGDHGRSD